MSISDLARHSPGSIFGTSAECRCQSLLDIRNSSIYGTSAECRYQSRLDIPPVRYSNQARHSLQLDIRDKCRMSMSELARLLPGSIFGNSAECRCQSWLDIRPSSIIGTNAE
ncbi:hypothetical protein DPMN_063328 [Dreissena polymorpha]|uniref:Uncharacterized protein n=1 Tax=Dreissena polymorpha TaxID=45954 RepID=A0A9D4CB53_DREPO|nr:hypothetical protein DPMN_063328 [Dreissena polymorpha]